MGRIHPSEGMVAYAGVVATSAVVPHSAVKKGQQSADAPPKPLPAVGDCRLLQRGGVGESKGIVTAPRALRSIVGRSGGRGAITTEVAALALVANRVATAVRRALDGGRLSAADRRHLKEAREQLLSDFGSSAAVVRSATRHLQSRGLIVTAARAAGKPHDSAALESAVRSYAEDLDRLSRGDEAKHPHELLKYYQELAAAARRQSRRRVETVTRSR